MTRNRIIFFIVFLAMVFTAFFGRLIDLQIVNGESYYEKTQMTVTKKTGVAAARGEVLDRYGRPLIVNDMKYVVYLEKSFIPEGKMNDNLLKLAKLFKEHNIAYTDTMPISEFPYRFLSESSSSSGSGNSFSSFLNYYGIKNNGSAPDVMEKLATRFGLLDYCENDRRILVGLQYDMFRNGTSSGVPLLLASDVGIDVVTVLAENSNEYPGAVVEAETNSRYVYPGYASHILGRVGKISDTEYKQLKDSGYSINDYVGKDGIEKAFESYLRGINGVKTTYLDSDYNIIGSEITTEPKNGSNVVLTIDIELQMAVEDAIKETIEDMQKNKSKYPNGDGDADAGAVVILNVKTGEVLALASYPTYDLTTFSEDYNILVSEESNLPLFNRAISGAYEPGSTFKLISAIMGLNEKLITSKTVFNCTGRYTYYKDYQPYCYGQRAHGVCDVERALRVSCNAFFFDIMRQMGLAKHNEYSWLLGFGQTTGIELAGEVTGYYLSKELYDARNLTPGYQLMVAIGQQTTVTPIQLASYVQMIANGENRYKPHLLKEVISSDYSSVEYEEKATVTASFSELNVTKSVLDTVRSGMRGVITGNSSRNKSLGGYGVAGKTGTAEVSDGSPTAVFVCYAPYEDPEIAVAAVIEHGGEGGYLESLIEKIMKQYFSSSNETNTEEKTGTLVK